MEQQMLRAAQEAAWAAQSAADAAWWALLVNGLVVATAVGATAYQDHRVSARLRDQARDFDTRARMVLERACAALTDAAEVFHAADGTAGRHDLDAVRDAIQRAFALNRQYQSATVSVDVLAALIKAEGFLQKASVVLKQAHFERAQGDYNNAARNGQIDALAADLQKDISSLARH